MAKDDPTIADAIRASHPTPEELLALHGGRLAPADAARVREHLSRCELCREESAAVARFLDPAEVGEDELPFGEAEAEDIWRHVSPSLRKPAPWYVRPRPLQWLAACLLLTTLAFALAWGSARRQAARFADAELNVPIQTLEPPSFLREGGGPAPAPTPVAPGAVLILTPEEAPADIEHGVEIVDSAGTVMWSGQGLRPTPRESFHLRLPRNLRPGADYRISILAPGAGGTRKVATALITIAPAE